MNHEVEDPQPDSLNGYFLLSDTLSFIEQTDTLQRQTGFRFGIEYVLQGLEEENAQTFEVRIVHPLLHHPITDGSSADSVEIKAGCIEESYFVTSSQ